MSHAILNSLRHLDHCLDDRESLDAIRAILDKIGKACEATEHQYNIATLFNEPSTIKAMTKTFGEEGYEIGLQLTLKLALREYSSKSFLVNRDIEGDKKSDFLFRSVGGWKQFDTVLAFQFRGAGGVSSMVLVNPAKRDHWQKAKSIPAGTMVTVYLKTVNGKRSGSQEELALDRYLAIFDAVQSRNDFEKTVAPVVQLRPGKPVNGHAAPKSSELKKAAPRITPSVSPFSRSVATSSGPPVLSFQVVVNKVDTFVHAGNAQLIIKHLSDYAGRVEFYVLRGEKKRVQLDADSIWGAEIRNGETVLFEFFGPQPDEGFVKELARKTNKYTQMDKVTEK